MKRNILLITALILLISINLLAQQYGWVKIAQLGTPSYNEIYTVFFIDSLNGWVGMSH